MNESSVKTPNPNINSDQALRWAAASGDIALVQELLTNGVGVDACDNAALRSAVRHGHSQIVQRLLNYGAPLRDYAPEFLNIAATSGFPDVMRVLLRRLPAFSAHEETDLIRKATKSGNIPTVSVLLEAFNHPRIDDPEPLITASCQGNAPMIRLLIQHGADVNTLECKAIFNSVFSRSIDALNCLIDAGANCETQDGTALHLAILQGDPEMVEILLSAGVPISCPDWIMDSAAHDSLQTLQLLLEQGFTLQDFADGLVARAADAPAPRILAYVLDHATVNQSALDDGLPVSVRKAAAPVIRLLLDRRADPTAQKSLALALALQSQEFGIAGWLLDAGAAVPDLDPSTVAHAFSDASMFRRLLRAGARVDHLPLVPMVATRLFKLIFPEDLFMDSNGHIHPEEICTARLTLAEALARTAAGDPAVEKVEPTVWLSNVLAASPLHPHKKPSTHH